MDRSKVQVMYVYAKSKEAKDAFLLGIVVSLTRSRLGRALSLLPQGSCEGRTCWLALKFLELETLRPLEVWSHSNLKIMILHTPGCDFLLTGMADAEVLPQLVKVVRAETCPQNRSFFEMASSSAGSCHPHSKEPSLSYNQNFYRKMGKLCTWKYSFICLFLFVIVIEFSNKCWN